MVIQRTEQSTTRPSLVIYLALMAYLVLVKVILELGSVQTVTPAQANVFTWPVIGFLAIAGGCAVWLSPRTGLPALWDPAVPQRKWLLLAAGAGLGAGAINLTVQGLTGYVHILAEAVNVTSINVPFPESILVYSGGAIVVEALYRLILITLPMWLIANVILRKRGQAPVFWAVALVASLLEPVDQMSLVAGHLDVMLVVGVLVYAMNIFEAHLLWRYGFLAPLVFRLNFYLVWHVVGGLIGL